ncbi:MAG: N-acetyltransferase [Lachnospira sp.]|nr:N-acetyltransferase [Lachnospira sp.]
MIRKFRKNDLSIVMEIWLNTNIQTHDFISEKYWTDNYEMVKEMMPQAEVYVYEDDKVDRIDGFIGLTGDYIAGIFVRSGVRSKGIGKKLLDYVKAINPSLSLNVYQKNVRAICFYQREGFVIKSENIDYDTNEIEFVMGWSR